MLTQTSELAIKSILFLSLEQGEQPISPRQIAESLGCSPSYLAKTVGKLVRSGILRSMKGSHGGVVLARGPEEITLLAIIESCQGLLIANYCQEIVSHEKAHLCAFHQAMNELHSVTVDVLSRWTIQDLMQKPASSSLDPGMSPPCKMAFRGSRKLLSLENDTPGKI